MSFEDRMQALIKEMSADYYRARQIDKIPEAIKIRELYPGNNSDLEFFRISIHSSIPNEYLEADIPIIGMGSMGRSIAFGEDKAIVDHVSTEVSHIQLDELNFESLIQDAYERINNSIGAIFYPIDFFTKMHEELDIRYMNDFMVIKKGIDEIKMIPSTNFSKWNQIVILGKKSIEWTRKFSTNLPPNLSNYKVFSGKDEPFQSAYKMTSNEVNYIIGTINNCRVIDPNNVIVYIPPVA